MKRSDRKKNDKLLFRNRKNVIKLPSKRTVGMDIGTKNIKLAAVKGNRILSVASEPIPNGVIVDGVIEAQDILAKCLKRAKKQLKGSLKHVNLCLSGKDVIMREIKLPQMKEDQVLQNIKSELSNIYLLASGDYVIDYRILETINDELTGESSMRVLVVSAPKALISDYMKVCKKAGIRLESIDVYPNAHTKLVRKIINDSLKNEKAESKEKEKNNSPERSEKKAAKKKEKAAKKSNEQEIKTEEKSIMDDYLRPEPVTESKKEIKEKEKLEKESREEALRKARENAEAAAVEASKRRQQVIKDKEKIELLEKKEAENKRNKIKEQEKGIDIDWCFGQKLNDLGEGLYTDFTKETASEISDSNKTEPKEEKSEIVPSSSEENISIDNDNPLKNLNSILKYSDDIVVNDSPETVERLENAVIQMSSDISDLSFVEEERVAEHEEDHFPMELKIDDKLFEIEDKTNPASLEADIKEAMSSLTEEDFKYEAAPLHNSVSDDEANEIFENIFDAAFGKEESEQKEQEKSIFDNVCIVDIGFTMSNVTFIKNGSYSMHKNIRYGGEYINEAISEKMSLDMVSAESFKISKNDDTEGMLYEYYDSIISELDNTMYYYKTNNNQHGVDCIIIAGGSSRLGGIKDYFSKELNVPVYTLSEISGFSISPKIKNLKYGNELHIEDYVGAVAITLKAEWV